MEAGGHMAGERHAGDLAKVRATAPPMNPLPHRSRRSCSRATFLSSFDCWLALDGTARSGGEASTKRWIREVEILAAAPELESLRWYGGRAYSYTLGPLKSNKLYALVGKRTL